MNLRLPGGKAGERDNYAVLVQHVYTASYKMDNQQAPTV